MAREPSTRAADPALTDVLVGTLAARQHDEAAAQPLELVALQRRHDVQWRGLEEVVRDGTGEEAPEVERAAHADGQLEHVREQADAAERVEGADRRAGGDELDVVGVAIGADRRDDLVADELEELPLHPRLVGGVALAGEQDPAVDAVDRVQLHPPGLDQVAARLDEEEALDLLAVAPGGREHQDGRAERAPADHRDVPFDSRRVPGRGHLRHGRVRRRSRLRSPPASAGCGSRTGR